VQFSSWRRCSCATYNPCISNMVRTKYHENPSIVISLQMHISSRTGPVALTSIPIHSILPYQRNWRYRLDLTPYPYLKQVRKYSVHTPCREKVESINSVHEKYLSTVSALTVYMGGRIISWSRRKRILRYSVRESNPALVRVKHLY
jgi:hypothetical protein